VLAAVEHHIAVIRNDSELNAAEKQVRIEALNMVGLAGRSRPHVLPQPHDSRTHLPL
jgi:hypothetical protein